jgi:hypothetical protein
VIPFPRWSYLPGGDREPDRNPLEIAKSRVPTRFDGFVPVGNAAFIYGLVLNDGGWHWEAHEVLEAVWKAAPMNGPDRLALQALIQIANAGLKQRMERPRAAGRLVEHASALLRELVMRQPTADETSVAGRLRVEGVAAQLRGWTPGTKLYLTPDFAFGEEQKCIKADESSWTSGSSCIIMHKIDGKTQDG